MRFTKERAGNRCIVRWGYSGELAMILAAVEEARKDFPWLQPENIEVVKYGGDTIKRHVGIEFNVTDTELIPNDYYPLRQIHLTL